MTTNLVARVAKTQAGQLLHAQALKADERTPMQKAQDVKHGMERLAINSALSVPDGYQFINEIEATTNRVQRHAVIKKWQACVNVLKTQAKATDSKTSQYRASKAAAAARALGWTVEYSGWNIFKRIYWAK